MAWVILRATRARPASLTLVPTATISPVLPADTTARIWPISEAAFAARLREIAKPCLNVREWRVFFPFDDDSTAKKKVDECEARASGAPTE